MGVIAAVIASRKGRNPFLWVLFGLLISWLAVVIILLLPNQKFRWKHPRGSRSFESGSGWRKKVEKRCPHCGSRIIIDDIPGNWACPNCGRIFTYGTDGRVYAKSEAIRPPVELIVKLFAKTAKADGVVTEEEVRQVDRIVRLAIRPDQNELHRIMDVFNAARYSSESFSEIARELYLAAGGRRQFLSDLLVALLSIAAADGTLHPQEESMLRRVAGIFRMESAYATLRSRFFAGSGSGKTSEDGKGDLDGCYRILGCSRDASDEAIKKKYRHLIKVNHPDLLVSRGASAEKIKAANKRVTEIKRAYEQIMTARS